MEIRLILGMVGVALLIFVDNSLCGVGLQKPSLENRSTHWRNSGCSLVVSRAFKILLSIKECIFRKACRYLW